MSTNWPLLAAFATGIASSLGPCLGPRVTALTHALGSAHGCARLVRAVAFFTGLCGAYVALGSLVGAVSVFSSISSYAYALVASVLAVHGFATMCRRTEHSACGSALRSSRDLPLGAIAVLGFATAATGSVCCGPMALLLAGAGSGSGRSTAVLAAAFAMGHVAPLLTLIVAMERIGHAATLRLPTGASATVAGALNLAFAGYYALLV